MGSAVIGRPRRRVPVPTVESAHLPAPSGVNLVDTASALAPEDATTAVNVVRGERGLRNRLGGRDWVTGLGGAVRTLLGFQGSRGDGSLNRLFAMTAAGIWDVSASTDAPPSSYAFPVSDAYSGRGAGRGFVNANGDHFLPFADETNGYIVYSETTGTWVKVVEAANAAWVKNTAYGAGSYVSNAGATYYTAAGGTSENTDGAGPKGTGAAIVDGTVTWAYAPAISGVDPTQIAFVTVWKNRIWLAKKNSATAYYLPVGAIYGAAASFHFGPQFRSGGFLVGLWSWTIDGGSGVDDYLVAISSAGDLVVYAGTDPASANTFGLKGDWAVGMVPAGRRIATDRGGDLLILSALGVMPLSKILSGASFQDADLYATRKIAPVIGRLMSERGDELGFEIRIHPEDKTLLVTTPPVIGEPGEQWSMSLAAQGWAKHTGLGMTCTEAWQGKMYYGTADGRVCVNDGDADNVGIAGAENATAIEAVVVTSFQNLGSARQKQLLQVAPRFLTTGTAPQFTVEGRYNFDLTDPGPVQFTDAGGVTTWGTPWGTMIWGSGAGVAGEYRGVAGIGENAAVALRWSAKSRCTLVGFDVQWDEGGTQ